MPGLLTRITLFSTLLAIAGLAHWPAQAAIKCWTNHEGFRECGNAIPPEYSQKSSQQLNEQGVVIDKTARAKTQAELDQEDLEAAAERKRQKAIAKQREADQLLLKSFASADDIELAKQGKLSSLKAEIQLRESHMEKLRASLEKFTHSAADMERRGEKPTEKMLNDIASVRTQIRDNAEYIELKKAETESVTEKYDADLLRYRKLQAAAH